MTTATRKFRASYS